MSLKKYLVIIPGIILAFVLYSLSQGFNNIIGIELLGYSKSPISTAMIAILYLTLTLGVKYNVNLETVYIAIKNKRPCINVELKYLQFASSYLSKNGLDMLSSKEKLF